MILSELLSSFMKDERFFAFRFVRKTCSGWMSDALYLRIIYRIFVGKRLHLNNPKTYTEKLQWLKIHDRNPLYTTMVDKFAAKKYVADKIGADYVIPTLGIWNCPKEVDFSILPNQFVLKTTFGAGGNDLIICKDKSSLDIKAAVKYLEGFMSQDSYKHLKEWPYKNVPRRVIAEKFMEEPGKSSLTDYKVMCFNGVAKLIELHSGRYTNGHSQVFYDREWNKTKITQASYGEVSTYLSERPTKLDEMLMLSEVLSKDIPHVRVDWYIIENKLYFGELTFFDSSGLDPFLPDDYNTILGEWITLPNNKK